MPGSRALPFDRVRVIPVDELRPLAPTPPALALRSPWPDARGPRPETWPPATGPRRGPGGSFAGAEACNPLAEFFQRDDEASSAVSGGVPPTIERRDRAIVGSPSHRESELESPLGPDHTSGLARDGPNDAPVPARPANPAPELRGIGAAADRGAAGQTDRLDRDDPRVAPVGRQAPVSALVKAVETDTVLRGLVSQIVESCGDEAFREAGPWEFSIDLAGFGWAGSRLDLRLSREALELRFRCTGPGVLALLSRHRPRLIEQLRQAQSSPLDIDITMEAK